MSIDIVRDSNQGPDRFLMSGDSRRAPDLLPNLVGKVNLAVTSPPYHNAISYESHVEDPSSNFRECSSISYEHEYLPFLDEVWEACHQMLAPGGFLAINVGTVLEGGHHYPLPQDILLRLMDHGWLFFRTIAWNKVTAGVKRAGSVIQHRLPGYWYPNILTEKIIVVRKSGHLRVNNSFPSEWLEPVWDLAPVPPNAVPHPAPFPEDLPHRLIRMLTSQGDFVFDPFLGAGATSKAAFDLGRIPAGIDLQASYVEYARGRMRSQSVVRASQLRIHATDASSFNPGPARGRTRHGSGVKART